VVEVRFVGELQKLSLSPDDVLVLAFDVKLSRDQREAIRADMERSFPGRRCIVTDGGGKMGVLENA
jgi:hypothetical protein